MSTGVGLRYAIGTNVNFRLDYGKQLEALNDQTPKDSRIHVGLTIAY